MTLKELMLEVSSLGFDSPSESEHTLLLAANRALRELFVTAGTLGSFCFYARRSVPDTFIREITFRGGEKTVLPLSGRAFSMTVSGKGRYTVTDRVGKSSEGFDTQGALVRGFLHGDATLTLEGDCSFIVSGLATYSEVYSDRIEDIPCADGTRTYNLREMIPDFHSPLALPTDFDGKEIRGASIADGHLTLPAEYSGSVRLCYRRLPRKISSEDTSDIDIPEEYSHLFPLLVASYVWLDREPELAAHYRERYSAEAERLKGESRLSLGSVYNDTNGWA
ncbi:MAG: hypothetical protein J6C39_05435 [Clostridia bacterium]|nr:hypothetical protein [Clostridia bacterium]MBO5207230.1 hypothetical protein [Clostridia bacterium]